MNKINKIKHKKYYITNLELKGFKGTKGINDSDGIMRLEIETDFKQQDIILFFAENGKGKSTILENLHPHPYMISRNIKDSIEYPAYKKITFKNKNTRIDCEVYWNSEKETKGYIYINENREEKDERGELYKNTEKGNITEFSHMVNIIFLEYNKFKNSLFMQQDILEIVKAKPAERAKIINNFSHPTISYEDIKTKANQKLEIIKSNMNIYEKEIEDYKGYENRYNQIKDFDEEKINNQLAQIKIEQDNNITKFAKLEDNKVLFNYKSSEIKKIKEKLSYIDINSIKNRLKTLEKEIKENKEEVASQNIIKNSEKIQELNETTSMLKTFNNKLIDINIQDNLSIQEEHKIKEELKEIIYMIENHKHINYINNNLTLLEKEEIKFEKEKSNINEELNKIKKELQNNKINYEEINEEVINKYEKNKTLISNLKSLKSHIQEELNTLKNNLENINKNIITEKEQDIINKELNVISEKLYLIYSKEKEKREIEKILKNIEENSTEEKYICKCCKSELDKDNIINHLKEINEIIKNKESFEEQKKIMEEQINKNKQNIEKREVITKSIVEKEKEMNHNKFFDLEKKEEATRKILLLSKEYTKISKEIYSTEEKINTIIKKKHEIKNELDKYENLLIQKVIKEEINFFHNRRVNLENKLLIIEILKVLNISEMKNTEEIKDMINKEIKEKETELKKEKAVVEKYKLNMEKINILNNYINENTEKKKNYYELKDKEDTLEKEINKMNFSEEEYNEIKNILEIKKAEYERINTELLTYKKDKEFIEELMEEYIAKTKKLEELKKEEFIYKKIKIYSDRIKKAQVSNFFSGITQTINQIIASEEGTLSDLQVSITQKGNKNLNIRTKTKLNIVEDISLLSGAEKRVVSRGISLALAKENNFGIVYIDESDGGLSKKNREQFFKTIKKTQQIVDTNQIFVISHNEDLLLLADKIITFE